MAIKVFNIRPRSILLSSRSPLIGVIQESSVNVVKKILIEPKFYQFFSLLICTTSNCLDKFHIKFKNCSRTLKNTCYDTKSFESTCNKLKRWFEPNLGIYFTIIWWKAVKHRRKWQFSRAQVAKICNFWPKYSRNSIWTWYSISYRYVGCYIAVFDK